MFGPRPDRHDDTVDPLRPWRSASLVFLTSWAVVLADVLDLPIQGRAGRREGYEPVILWLPFLALAAYLALCTPWRLRERRARRAARALRAKLRDGAAPEH